METLITHDDLLRQLRYDAETGAFIELSAAIAARQLAEQKIFGTFTRKGEAA